MALADSSSSSSSSLMDSPKIFKTCPLLFSAFPNLPFFPSPPSPRHHLLSTAMDRLLHKLSDSLSQAPKTFFRALLSPFSDSQRHVFPRIRFRQSVDRGPLSAHNFAAILPGDTAAGVVVANGILNFLNIYSSLLVVRLVLTWFPNAPPAIVSPLSTLCDPYLNIFRGIIPPLGGTLDFSPILAFLVLNAFTSAAAALPAELPASGRSQLPVSQSNLFNLKATQAKWMRRVSRRGPKEIDESN